MIKQNCNKTVKSVVAPDAFVKESAAAVVKPSYDWTTQRNSEMAYGTMRQTFANPPTWEND